MIKDMKEEDVTQEETTLRVSVSKEMKEKINSQLEDIKNEDEGAN